MIISWAWVRSIGRFGGRRSSLQCSCMYRNGSRHKELAVSVRGGSRLVWLESRKDVDDGRWGVDQELSPQS